MLHQININPINTKQYFQNENNHKNKNLVVFIFLKFHNYEDQLNNNKI
jgi:hypothetical protein